MADNTAQFANQAQDVNRSISDAIQGLTGTQFNIMQRLGDVQRNMFSQAVEAANEQMQVLARIREPREFATAQADLVKSYGQKYVESVNEAVDIVVEGWQEYGDKLEKSVNSVTDKTQKSAPSKKS
ncbi:MAG: phasin family protein [Gammaproteobacteria bacterium]|nr:phasin family protein [Gammaproteobacteria bacterium]